MKTQIADPISRIRNLIKATNQDAFVTDRHLYGIILKHAHWLIKREDGQNKLMRFDSIFQTLDYVELEETDKIEASCTGLRSNCTFRRTKEELPNFLHGYYGPLIRNITSIDGSEELQRTNPSAYASISNSSSSKYNKTKYYWYLNNRIYFPNLEWEAVRIEGVFEGDLSDYRCDTPSCVPRQQQLFNIPEYLLGELENQVLKELGAGLQLPTDITNDKQNVNR